MSDRLAFAPLKSLETALDLSVQERARALFQNAKARTARGSGNDLDKSIAGNSTAIASACLLLAKTESEGASAEDLDVHQRHAMVTKPQFKVLVSTLQSVLDLRSGAKTAFTPTRGSARKRKIEAQDDTEEPVTPSKSAKGKQPSNAAMPADDRPSTPTRTSARKSARVSAAVEALSTSSRQKSKIDKDMELSTSSAPESRSTPRKTAPAIARQADAAKTPTKSSTSKEKGKQRATDAFDKAMTQSTPSKAKSIMKATPVKPAVDYSKPFIAIQSETEVKERQEDDIPYETYWGDLLIRYRRKEDVDARRQKTENWRQGMLGKLDVAI